MFQPWRHGQQFEVPATSAERGELAAERGSRYLQAWRNRPGSEALELVLGAFVAEQQVLCASPNLTTGSPAHPLIEYEWIHQSSLV
ncbi:hypothetical protein VTO42DRAFT_1302 [Malbranchea cinnamomea]